MKRSRIVWGIVAILVVTASVAGCGGGKTITPADTSPTATSPAPTTPSKTMPPETSPAPTTPSKTTPVETSPAPTAGETLTDILSMSAKIVSIKYDMLMTGPAIPTTAMTVWLKKNKMRTEINQQGVDAVTLIDLDAKTIIAYMPAQNMAIKMPFDPTQVPKAPTDEASSMLNYNAKVVGTESIDGKACSVVEYASEQGSAKAWIWQDYGLPLRIETTTSAGKITLEYKNIDFTDIPDSMFELPSGVNIMSL